MYSIGCFLKFRFFVFLVGWDGVFGILFILLLVFYSVVNKDKEVIGV